MKSARRQFLYFAAGAAASCAFVEIARAQTYPVRPVPDGGLTHYGTRRSDFAVTHKTVAH
jgi:hypothetical protein